MDGQIKVSCIMPTHNRSELLIRALDSLLSQSLREIEIIVVDDASTDHTPDVLAQRMQIDQRLIAVRNDKNLGPAESRNKGYAYAKGEYIIFLDSDDYFLDTMLEKAYTLASLYRCDLLVFDRILAQNEYETAPEKNADQFQIFLYEKGSRKKYISKLRNVPWNKLVKKNLIDQYQIRFQDLPAGNDIYYSYAVAIAAQRTLITYEPLMVYYINAANNISTSSKALNCNEVPAFQQVFQFMQTLKIEPGIEEEMIDHAVSLIVENANNRIRKYGNCDINEKVSEALFFREYLMQLKSNLHVGKTAQYFVAKLETGFDFNDFNRYENYGKLAKVFCEISEKTKARIALWGLGKIGTEILYYLAKEKCKLDIVIDQKKGKQGVQFLGYTARLYEEVCDEVDIVLVSTHKHINEILHMADDKVVIDLFSFANRI